MAKKSYIKQDELLLNEQRYTSFRIKNITAVNTKTNEILDGYSLLLDLQTRYSNAFIKYSSDPFKPNVPLDSLPISEKKEYYKKMKFLRNDYFSGWENVSYIINSLIIDSKAPLAANQTRINNLEKDISKLENKKDKILKSLDKVQNKINKARKKSTLEKYRNKQKKLKRKLNETFDKINSLNKKITSKVVYGGKKLYRYIRNLYFVRDNLVPLYEKFTDEELEERLKTETDYSERKNIQKYLAYSPELLQEKEEEFRLKRMRPIYISGEKGLLGNRQIRFHKISKNIIVFNVGDIQFSIEINVGKKQKELLYAISVLGANKIMPVSTKIDVRNPELMNIQLGYNAKIIKKYWINITNINYKLYNFSDEEFNNYKAVYEIYKDNVTEKSKKQVFVKKYGRVLGIDLNPDNIGISVIQRTGKYTYVVLHTEIFEYKELIKKLNLPSSDPKSKKQTNRQKHYLYNICHTILDIMKHFSCSMYVCEDLNFKKSDQKKRSRNVNRKIKNMWRRKLIEETMKKLCSQNDILYRQINPCYSSFIGNIQHPYGDSASAACEIARRGVFRYTKNTFFPHMSQKDKTTLKSLYPKWEECSVRDESDKFCINWKETYNMLLDCYTVNEINRLFRSMNVVAQTHSFRLFPNCSKIRRIVYEETGRECVKKT